MNLERVVDAIGTVVVHGCVVAVVWTCISKLRALDKARELYEEYTGCPNGCVCDCDVEEGAAKEGSIDDPR